jgi:hypothetical protein
MSNFGHFLLISDLCLSLNIFLFFFFCGAGAWTQGLHLEPFLQPCFVKDFFKIGSHELFAWAGFEPQSSWSLPPEQLGLQAWATGAWLNIFFENVRG